MATPDELAQNLFYSDKQEFTLLATERTASVLSMVSCVFVFVTFCSSKRFRKPINRLLFYATIGNFLMNIGTMTSLSGIYAGRDSPLCQFQGFLIQMFLPADAFWNLSMAINTYLTVFKKWPASRLKTLDYYYIAINYGSVFVVAFVYCFAGNNKPEGKIYGPAVLWCWVDSSWDIWRVISCYAPAWVAIFTSFCIYIAVGINIWRKRNILRAYREASMHSGAPRAGVKPKADPHWSENAIKRTTEMHVTSKVVSAELEMKDLGAKRDEEQYSYVCTAEAVPVNPFAVREPHVESAPNQTKHVARAALEAKSAAVGYAKCAMLFFVSLLVTWVPSSTFRVSSVVSPNDHIYGLAYATGLVLPLQGFWNSIIYFATSREAVKAWIIEDLGFGSLGKQKPSDMASGWLPPSSPRVRHERFSVRKGDESGSFDRLY